MCGLLKDLTTAAHRCAIYIIVIVWLPSLSRRPCRHPFRLFDDSDSRPFKHVWFEHVPHEPSGRPGNRPLVRRPEQDNVARHLLRQDPSSVAAVEWHLAGQHVMQHASCTNAV